MFARRNLDPTFIRCELHAIRPSASFSLRQATQLLFRVSLHSAILFLANIRAIKLATGFENEGDFIRIADVELDTIVMKAQEAVVRVLLLEPWV